MSIGAKILVQGASELLGRPFVIVNKRVVGQRLALHLLLRPNRMDIHCLRAFTGHGTANPGSPHGDKDRGSIADIGGSALGVDRRRVRGDASELKPLDAPSERSRDKGLGTREAAWASAAVNLKSPAAIKGRFREASFGIWVTASSIGWSHLGGPSEASVWDNLESSPGSVLNAPIGVSTEAGGIYVSSREE